MAQPHEVVSTEYPYLPIRVEVQGESIEALALLDTGYTGSLIVPETWQRPAVRPDGRTAVEVGDGRIVYPPVYLGILEVTGFAPIYGVAVTVLGGENILGRRVLDRYEITLDHGRRVIVRL